MVAVKLLVPAEQIALFREFERTRRLKFESQPLFDFRAKPVGAFFLQHIFEPGMFAVRAVAKVAVHRHHRLRRRNQLFARDEADDIGQTREGMHVAVAHAHAAAGEQVVTGELSVLLDGHKTQAVGEDVNVVEGRNDKRGLELARQIGFAVERVHEIFRRIVLQVQLLAFDPDLMIPVGFGQERVGNRMRVFLHQIRQRTDRGSGGRHDVAVHVAASRKRRGHGFVNRLHHRPQTRFDDAVKLKALARGDSQGVVPVLSGQTVEG